MKVGEEDILELFTDIVYISDFFFQQKNNELAFSLIASSKYYFWLFSYIFPTYRFFN